MQILTRKSRGDVKGSTDFELTLFINYAIKPLLIAPGARLMCACNAPYIFFRFLVKVCINFLWRTEKGCKICLCVCTYILRFLTLKETFRILAFYKRFLSARCSLQESCKKSIFGPNKKVLCFLKIYCSEIKKKIKSVVRSVSLVFKIDVHLRSKTFFT